MTLSQLDHIFPFFVFFYGVLLVFVLESQFFTRLANERMPQLFDTMKGHRALAWVCFWVGGFWSLQNLVFS